MFFHDYFDMVWPMWERAFMMASIPSCFKLPIYIYGAGSSKSELAKISELRIQKMCY